MKNAIKKGLMVLAVLVMVFSFTACGGDGGADVDYVTPEKYAELKAADWASMGQDEMEEFLGVEGVVDEETTESWGEGYLVVDFPGVDSGSYVHVLFSQLDDGTWKCSSIQPLGELAEAQ